MGITDYEIYHISIRVAKNIFDSEKFMKEIYHKYCQIPEENREDYLKEKLLEVLFLLSQMRFSAGCGEENDETINSLSILATFGLTRAFFRGKMLFTIPFSSSVISKFLDR